MADCTFSVNFTGSKESILHKTKSTIEGQGGTFSGDENQGSFHLSVMGMTVAGGYTVTGDKLDVAITEKPMMVPCAAIESFLQNQLSKV